MVTSGGFGGGPSLPMTGDGGPIIAVLALLLIVGAIFLMMRVFEY
jgi:LPXTG-motif cell wall-anchored protein